jgi:hypothetical protein
MDKESRIKNIEATIALEPDGFAKEEIVWRDTLQAMPVHKIKLEHLVYNKYNGRILTRTKSLEAQQKTINVETKEGKELIEKLLWESKEGRNKSTLDDLNQWGQKRFGIITRDGIIIDGNRRAMLLNKSGRWGYFKAIVLPVTLEQDPIEIEKLETSYQMGEDEKLGYNANEKYLKAQTLKAKKVSVNDIAKWMNESTGEIEKYLRIMSVMDEYLETFNYDKMYTRLDDREDAFISVEKWTSNLYGERSAKGFDGYTDGDVDDLKSIAFDYIRAIYENTNSDGKLDWKSLRILADGNKESHLFGNKEIWKDFSEKHFKYIDPIKIEEEPIKLDLPDLEKNLASRDSLFSEKTINFLIDNLDDHKGSLGNQKHANEPEKLLVKAIDAIKVAQANKNVGSDDVLDKVEELNDITVSIMRKKSPVTLLKHINDLLSSINPGSIDSGKEDIEEELRKIQHTAYKLSKDL